MILTSRDYYGSVVEDCFKLNAKVTFAYCSNPSLHKLHKLLRMKVLPLSFILKSILCKIKNYRFLRNSIVIYSIKDLESVLQQNTFSIILLFRANLIIPNTILSRYKVVNVHAAKLPEYRGLGAIYSALKSKDYEQKVVAHIATSKIDSGTILIERNYVLNPSKTYCVNERIAYLKGIEVLKDLVHVFSKI